MSDYKQMLFQSVLPGLASFLALVLCFVPPAVSQDRNVYELTLAMDGDRLNIINGANCEGRRLYHDLCVASGSPATVTFSLVTEGWSISEILIRDPAANWSDSLPRAVYEEFQPFNNRGHYGGSRVPSREISISVSNLTSQAVEYRVKAVNTESGRVSSPAHAVIVTGGSASSSRN